MLQKKKRKKIIKDPNNWREPLWAWDGKIKYLKTQFSSSISLDSFQPKFQQAFYLLKFRFSNLHRNLKD
jgi:hypothetical protein